MKITKQSTITQIVDVTVDVICNRCGNTCMDEYKQNYEGLIEAHICGGYGSKIGDEFQFEFSLCESCLLELFKTFKHNPLKDYNSIEESE